MIFITFRKPIPGFNFFALLLCEAVSFLYDLMVVKYADLVLVKQKTTANFKDLIKEIIRI
jgi:hypothetical protein